MIEISKPVKPVPPWPELTLFYKVKTALIWIVVGIIAARLMPWKL